MTTPEPRVRVRCVEWTIHGGSIWWHYSGHCDHCGADGIGGHPWHEVIAQAHRHAATCPALRLARLLRELEALRDRWIETAATERRSVYTAMDPYGLVGHANGIDYAAADLTALIDRATNGETG